MKLLDVNSLDFSGAVIDGVYLLRDGGSMEIFIIIGDKYLGLRIMRSMGLENTTRYGKVHVQSRPDQLNLDFECHLYEIKGLKLLLTRHKEKILERYYNILMKLIDEDEVNRKDNLNN